MLPRGRPGAVRSSRIMSIGIVALVALIASLAGTLAGPRSAAAIGGKRAAVLFPFDGGGNTWVSGDGPDVHTTYFSGFGWAEDLHAADGTAVRARFQSSDGAITLKVLAVDDLVCTPSAGKYVELEVTVDGTVAGQMIYEHLNNVPAAIAVNASIRVGDTLGYLDPWDQSPCWADTLARRSRAYPPGVPKGLLPEPHRGDQLRRLDASWPTQFGIQHYQQERLRRGRQHLDDEQHEQPHRGPGSGPPPARR